MPSLTAPFATQYVPAPATSQDLDYAELPVINLAKAVTPEGRAELAVQVRDAMVNQGFFYAINHGYTPSQTERMFDIADVPFKDVKPDEKQTYAATMKETGSYQGYKLRQYWHIGNGVHDQVEHYNSNRDVTKREHPQPVRPFLPEIEAFARHNHLDVLHPILRLLALGLELPEETLVDLHGYSAVGETYVRFMKYYPRSEEEEAKTGGVWLKGHTGCVYFEPVFSEILTVDGKWKWVKHIENALVINAGDALEFLSGGFYRATIHRVVQPPPDQQNHTRLGVFYFCMTDDDVKLTPLTDSPVLKRVGLQRRFADEEAPTMEVWRKGRTSAYGQSQLKPAGSRVEEEIINGVVVKHYN